VARSRCRFRDPVERPDAAHLLDACPSFILWQHLHAIDTFLPLIVPAWFGNSFFIFLLRQFFRSIPRDLEEAARIDGASILRTFISIVLPLAKPALAVVAIFAFMGVWNDFGPLIYLNSTDNLTLAVGLNLFLTTNGTRWSCSWPPPPSSSCP
jgi:ABC-type glycerol-3-phosphate transport system permease component